MKRIIMILSLVMILGLSACDASGSAVNSDKREDRKEEKAEGGQAGTVAQGNEYRPFWASFLDTSSEVYNNDLAMMAAEHSEEAEDAYADKIKKCYKEKYLIPCVFNASSPYAKFGHTEVYCDDSLHDDEPEITSCNNHEMSNYRRALEEERRQGSDGSHLLHLSCQGDDFEPVSGNSTAEISSVEDFSIEGSWKSVGDEGFGQAQPGATVTFDGEHCNFYSPYDTYNLYEEDGVLKLACKNILWQDVVTFVVEIVDDNYVKVIYTKDAVTELKRVS